MPTSAPRMLDSSKAAKDLLRALRGHGRDFTIADASAKSGLPLRDAETGLHALVSEYRGHLRVTEDGELLFRFPHGFTKTWEIPSRAKKVGRSIASAMMGFLRFLVRAWITIVLVGYTVIFVALLLGIMFARGSSSDSRDRDRSPSFGLGYIFFRIVADALFWTFHPFSPVHLQRDSYRMQRGRSKEGGAFYDKVNRFFFGPPAPPTEPREMERRVLAEIRSQKGRIGLSDVMRVTGLPREEADPMMARLMLDYDGTVDVSEEGGIVYRFAAMRRTVDEITPTARPAPIWSRQEKPLPLTSNSIGTNVLIIALNAFNLLMSSWILQNGLTIDNLRLLSMGIPMQQLPDAGTPLALGLIPFVFSLLLFAIPLVRILWRPIEARRMARENGRRAILREVLTKPAGVMEKSIENAYRQAAGRDVDTRELTRHIVALGGDVDIEAEGGIRYRFPELEAENAALRAEREAAAEEEARVGKIVYSSED